jgi:hypothetical protein
MDGILVETSGDGDGKKLPHKFLQGYEEGFVSL